MAMRYGPKPLELPFGIKLNEYIAEKYPGTEKGYASFKRKVTVQDERPFDYDLFMNNILDHRGYRFFQTVFDPDENVQNLSVNHDQWGTWITYLGYFLLYAGLMGIMFFGKTRFKDLAKQLDKVVSKKTMSAGILLLLSFGTLQAQEHSADDGHDHVQGMPTSAQVDSILQTTFVTEEHAEKFGQLVIQDDGGRMKPMHTFSSELLRKLSFKEKYKDMNANQVFLSMMLNPAAWYNTEFIALDKKGKNDSLRSVIGVSKDQKYVKAIDYFDAKGRNKLEPFLEDAFAALAPNKFQRDFKDSYFRLSLLDRALSGEIVKIFPLLNDENNKWISAVEYRGGQYQVADSLYANFVKNAIPYYLMTLQKANSTGDYSEADKLLAAFKQNQKNHGSEVLPSDRRIKTEVVYNKLNIFFWLYRFYAVMGLLLFFILIFQIFKNRRIWQVAAYFLKGTIVVLFLWHTAGLILRWYISGHAPWSDAYESILFVSWAAMGVGMLFIRKSTMTIAAASIVTSLFLFFAHKNWVVPAIGNLVAVLDSYCLMID